MGTSLATSGSKTARVALIGMSDEAQHLLQECFAQFEIAASPLTGDLSTLLGNQPFEACVLRLDGNAPALLEAARNSAANKRMVIYGVCDTPQDAMRYSRYGINAVFLTSYFSALTASSSQANRQAITRVVRGTHLLVVHELRRYIRIPIVTDVTVETEGRRFTAFSLEVSAGGLSFTAAPGLRSGQNLHASFALPDLPRLTIGATVSWLREPDEVGIAFNLDDERRLPVRDWVDKYLDMF